MLPKKDASHQNNSQTNNSLKIASNETQRQQ